MKFFSFFVRASLPWLCATAAFCVEPSAPLAELKLARQFDRNGDNQLDAGERQAARAYLAQHPASAPVAVTGRPGPAPIQSVALEPVKTGEKSSPNSVSLFPDQPLYNAGILRTVFFEFKESDWEKELSEFARTDISVPADLTIDGKSYSGVGVHFHTPIVTPATAEGYKRALDVTLDYTIASQQFGGQRQLRLLDAASDPSFLRTVLYAHVAQQYLPALQANLVRVVINGENWGIYTSVQPFDEKFIKESFGVVEGARWSVSAGGNLDYIGDKADAYRASYHLLSPEDPAAWTELMRLCKILNQTPVGELEAALAPHLNIDSTLKFLALENVLINQGGYGSSIGGYGLYLSTDRRFHLVPQETEASFRLVEISEYDKRPRRSEPRPDRKGKARNNPGHDATVRETNPLDPALQGYNPNNFPRQSKTDFAMLLSYSFINKSDSDLDEKVTKDEWLTFARSWFLVMDEDFVGKLTRDQFIAKFRGLLTPASIADGRTKQTFGPDDAAAIIGEDFFHAMDENRDGQLVSQEVTNTFARWFTSWSDSKSAVITRPALQNAFAALFSRSVFQADQSYIARRDLPILGEDSPNGRGGRRGGGGGNGINLGLLHVGGRDGQGGTSRTLVTFSEELDPLAGTDDETKPLRAKLLAVPALRARYLDYVRDITENWLTWTKLGPVAKQYHALIAAEVAKETHKAGSYTHFVQELDQDTTGGSRDGGAAPSLKYFVNERHDFLLKDNGALEGADGG